MSALIQYNLLSLRSLMIFLIFLLQHYNDVIMTNMASKTPASRFFTQSFIQTQIKENIKAPRHWPLCGKSPGPVNSPVNSPHKGPVTRKMFSFHDVIMNNAGNSQMDLIMLRKHCIRAGLYNHYHDMNVVTTTTVTVMSLLEAPYLTEAPLNGSTNCHKIVAPPQNRSSRRFQWELRIHTHSSITTYVALDHSGNHDNLFFCCGPA